MKKLLIVLMCLLLLAASAHAEVFGYRFADADEGAELMLSNREYYDNLNQNDLRFRLQKLDVSLDEMETVAAAQTRDYTEAERAAIDGAMAQSSKFAPSGATPSRRRTASCTPRPPWPRRTARAAIPTARRSIWAM